MLPENQIRINDSIEGSSMGGLTYFTNDVSIPMFMARNNLAEFRASTDRKNFYLLTPAVPKIFRDVHFQKLHNSSLSFFCKVFL